MGLDTAVRIGIGYEEFIGLVPFELQLKIEGFNQGRLDDLEIRRRIAWESEALARHKTLPSLDAWRKKMQPTPEDDAEERRMAKASRELLEQHTATGDEEALQRFVMKQQEADG